jgi:two-component system response regulator NreC
MSIKLVLADDHSLIRVGLQSLIEKETDLQIIGQASDGRQTVSLVQKLKPDIVIMDISMPGLNGIEATRQIKAIDENIKIIALSVHDEALYVRRMLKAGASGYLVKHSDFNELVEAIRAVTRDQLYLSPRISNELVHDYLKHLPDDEATAFSILSEREREILQLLAEGKTKQEIAKILFLSVKTVDSHRQNIMNKLSITTLSDLIRYAIREGISEL